MHITGLGAAHDFQETARLCEIEAQQGQVRCTCSDGPKGKSDAPVLMIPLASVSAYMF